MLVLSGFYKAGVVGVGPQSSGQTTGCASPFACPGLYCISPLHIRIVAQEQIKNSEDNSFLLAL
jgi:hypothetical protein